MLPKPPARPLPASTPARGGSVGVDDFDVDVDFVWRLCATRYEAVGFV
ncbi:MAG: hypothetical protein LBH93_04025 [Chitinispirillales bacterium]|nr:hypothetical protein [Chitinispirillales bacterium]